MRFPLRAALVAASLALIPTAHALAQEPVDNAEASAGAAWMSKNVEFLGSIKQDVGLTTGAKVVPGDAAAGIPDRLFVTSGKNFTIYDISDPAHPKTMGTINHSIAWEGEEVPTNGKILVISTDYYSADNAACVQALAPDGCVQIYDVSDSSNIKLLGVVGTANHTSECALNCTWIYGSAGSIINAEDPTHPVEVGNWITELKNQPGGVTEKSCHHVRELRPGILLTACEPFAVMSINASDGGSPAHPKLLAYGVSPRFVHSARWPNHGTDKFVLEGGENNFTGVCSRNQSTFAVYSAQDYFDGRSNVFTKTDEIAPANGTFTNGNAPAGELGCSVHWFQEHPTFHNGGLVALAEYENGVKFLQVTPDGGIFQVGYFLAAGSSASSPKWAPDGRTVYVIDYHRGLDIIRWNGDTYRPDAEGIVRHQQGRIRGTSAGPPAVALRAARQGEGRLLQQLHAVGWVPNYCILAAAHQTRARL